MPPPIGGTAGQACWNRPLITSSSCHCMYVGMSSLLRWVFASRQQPWHAFRSREGQAGCSGWHVQGVTQPARTPCKQYLAPTVKDFARMKRARRYHWPGFWRETPAKPKLRSCTLTLTAGDSLLPTISRLLPPRLYPRLLSPPLFLLAFSTRHSASTSTHRAICSALSCW